jgi:hypothetical protein
VWGALAWSWHYYPERSDDRELEMRLKTWFGIALAGLACGGLQGVAQAKPPMLTLREHEGGAALVKGASLVDEFAEDFPSEALCEYLTPSELLSNQKPTDQLKVGFALPGSCEEPAAEHFWSGTISRVKLTGEGTVTVQFKPKLAVPTEAGQCVYETSKLTGPLALPAYVFRVQVFADGTLNKSKSGRSCPKAQRIVAFAGVANENGKSVVYAEA